jgi:hypothetical protein
VIPIVIPSVGRVWGTGDCPAVDVAKLFQDAAMRFATDKHR